MKYDVLIIGAGACGLMAARELGKYGKKVAIIEARGRVGGRIMPLDKDEFGYPAQAGAEFVHGEAPIIRKLIREAGLTFVQNDMEIWSTREGQLKRNHEFQQADENLIKQLTELKEDIPLAEFLATHLSHDPAKAHGIFRMVEGYEAADPTKISTFVLRDDWLGQEGKFHDGRIKEGYGAMLDYLKADCEKNGVKIFFDTPVKSIEHSTQGVVARAGQKAFEADKAIVTVPLPILKNIQFVPPIKEQIKFVDRIGYGHVIKLVLRFKTRWWEKVGEVDLSKMAFLLCDEPFMTWWTQLPIVNETLLGWMAGPTAEKNKDKSDAELFELGIDSLSKVFGLPPEKIKGEVKTHKLMNWSADPYGLGAYSYNTVETKDAREKLAAPIDGVIYIAGEAVYSGDETAMVEGALGSGLEVAAKILNS